MSDLLKKPSFEAHLGKHGFDLSKRVLFTATTGQLLPVINDFLSSGESVLLDVSQFIRTQPMETSAFTRITSHVDFFFVPMRHLDSYFEQNFYGISDFSSSLFIPELPSAGNSGYYMFTPTTADLRKSWMTYGINSSTNGGDAVVDSTDSSKVDLFGVPRISNFIRLASLLGYSENLFIAGEYINYSDVAVNLYPFLAYQKIYYDYYRLSEWESNQVYAYNLDSIVRVLTSSSNIASILNAFVNNNTNETQTRSIFDMHYRPWKKDYFTNVFPSPLFDVETSPSGRLSSFSTSGDFERASGILSSYGIQPQDSASIGTNPNTHNPLTSTNLSVQPGSGTYPQTTMNLNTLRAAYAWERLLSITNRAGKHYDDQTLAHFGYKVPKGVSNECYYLGSRSSKVIINDVVATATTDAESSSYSVLGETAGRGIGASKGGKDIKFTAPCHGYLMGIFSIVPESDYSQFGINRLNTYNTINDYYRPEFNNLGMQPLYNFTKNYVNASTAPDSTFNLFLGWQYRWAELKMSYDSVHGAFNHTMSSWVSTRKTYYMASEDAAGYRDYYKTFLIDPSALDSIFLVNFNPVSQHGDDIVVGINVVKPSGSAIPTGFDISPVFERDPFLCALDFKYYKSSTMSPYSLPTL